MVSKQPIGVFDSGYGGLTVLKEIRKLLPDYDYLYLGDNARAPYGPLSFDTVYAYTREAVKYLFDHGCPLVILACNTASAKALRSIQQKDLPKLGAQNRVLGVIRPTSEVVGEFTTTGHVGVLATAGTVASGSYLLEIKKFFPGLTVEQEACPEWVDLVEAGEYAQPSADEPVRRHIENLRSADPAIDCLLLACTHYPLLKNKILEHVPAGVSVLEQGEIVAKSLHDYLQRHPELEERLSKSSSLSFLTTGDDSDFDAHGSLFFAAPILSTKIKLPAFH